ncbi:MAG: LptF/LptG family permease [Candidatus Neomarinimicrobiota bacterium]
MKRLDLYLIQQFISILLISILGFTSVFLVVDLIENLDRFIDNSVPWSIVFKYYLLYYPMVFKYCITHGNVNCHCI